MAARLKAAASRRPEHHRLLLCVAISYGGRQEVARAARELAGSVATGDITFDEIDESLLTAHLHEADYSIPSDPDLVIRTGGHQRLSNFLLYQSAYAELLTHAGFWPDFNAEDLSSALTEYARRRRNYGMLPGEKEPVLELVSDANDKSAEVGKIMGQGRGDPAKSERREKLQKRNEL
jgi:undecaprenyl diphosphate synthase